MSGGTDRAQNEADVVVVGAGACGALVALPMPPHRMNRHAQVLARGAAKLGARVMGTRRMGDDPEPPVVNSYGRSHDVPNLFICDTSVFAKGSGMDPTLTAMAIASRAAEHIVVSARRGEL